MKVAHITPTFFGDASVVGGGERYALELSRALSARAEVSLFTFGRDTMREVVQDGGLEIRRYPARRFIKGNLANPFTMRFLRDLDGFDVLHCYGYPKMITDLCILYAGLRRRKLCITDVHGGGVCFSTYLGKLGVDTARFADGLLLLSAYNARRYAPHSARVRIVGGGVDTARFRPGAAERERRVLFVGRLLPVKGVEHLIDALEAGTPARIVGRPYDPQYYDDLRRRASGKPVEFRTEVGERDLADQYRSAAVTVVPSVYTDSAGRPTSGELFGLVALESLSCGTPVIVTRCGGLPEVVEDGVTGFVVPPNDSDALRAKIRLLLADSELARTMGEAGRRRVLENFTWDRVAARCLDAYREVLGAA